MITKNFWLNQINQIKRGGIKILLRKAFIGVPSLVFRVWSPMFGEKTIEFLIKCFGQSKYKYNLYPLLLKSIETRRNKLIANALLSKRLEFVSLSEKFLEYFLPYIQVKTESIFEWRLTAYQCYFILENHVGMQSMMTKYLNVQKSAIEEYQLDFLNIRILNSNVFLANFNVNFYLDTYIKSMLLGWQPTKDIVVLLNAEAKEKIPNKPMFELWKKYVKVIDEPHGQKLVSSLAPYLLDDPTIAINIKGQGIYAEYAKCIVQKEWEKQERKPLIQLDKNDIEIGREMMSNIGLPKDAWFVCVHVRDAGCKTGGYSNPDSVDSFRNADIDSYSDAIDAIIKRGGYAIRVGDPNMKPIKPKEGLIDYAYSDIRSPQLDIFLFSQCRFFIGTASGPIMLASVFGTPLVATNYAPLINRVHLGNSLTIYKLGYDRKENKFLTYRDAIAKVGKGFVSVNYESKDLSLIDNSAEDIASVTEEMIDILDGNKQYSVEDNKLQDKIQSIYDEFGDYHLSGRIGNAFLTKLERQGLL